MNEDQPMELIESSSQLEVMERAQIDIQVATAKRYPRNIKTFLAEAESMITATVETAESCFYVLKRKGKGGKEAFIEGPSIRLLEIAAVAYGNVRYGSTIVKEDEKFVTTRGGAFDIQKNVAISVDVRRRITTSDGKKFGDDMIAVTCNAAGAIARRNALNGVIPRSYVNQLCDKAKEVAAGKAESLATRRDKAFSYFREKLGVEEVKVLKFLEKTSLHDVTTDDLVNLSGLKTALKEGDATIDEVFNDAPQGPEKATFSEALKKNKDSSDDAPKEDKPVSPMDNPKTVPKQSPMADLIDAAALYGKDTMEEQASAIGLAAKERPSMKGIAKYVDLSDEDKIWLTNNFDRLNS